MQKRGTFLYTALLLIETYLPVKLHVDTSYRFCVILWTEFIRKFSETTGPTEAKFHVAPP